MTTTLPTREMKTLNQSPTGVSKQRKVLACVLCQQRKVRCDRQFPCGNCVKARAQCVSSTLIPRKRKRRFPERALLDRVRQYEDLLRQNNIDFEPLHKDVAVEGDGSDDEPIKTAGTASSTASTPASITWSNTRPAFHRQHRRRRSEEDSSDDEGEVMVKQAWNQIVDTNDHLLFGFRKTTIQTSDLHPEPVHIFRLWQIYLENVEPLLKVIHAPSLQSSIVEAASGNVSNIKPPLEALMFGIYSMAVFSLDAEVCQTTFGSAKSELLTNYWYGCQQSLVNCGFLHTNDRDTLTALFLYLVSLRHSTLPQSLSSMLGIAVRIAQRMGMHSESALSRCRSPFEAEMRRRLWWSLVLFDSRVGELAHSKSPSLTPMWDCAVPLNVNDSDLRPGMKEAPPPSPNAGEGNGRCTESLFAVVRCALGDVIRQTMFNLFVSPASKFVARDLQRNPMPESEELEELERTLEERFFRHCDLDEPLHYMTVWTTRAAMAKCRILELNFRSSSQQQQSADAAGQRRVQVMIHARRMLECDTHLMASPLTEKFRWLVHFYFPMFAYIQIAQILKRQPDISGADDAWTAMAENYEVHFGSMKVDDTLYPFFKVFAEILFQAWDTVSAESADVVELPRIVTLVKEKLSKMAPQGKAPESVTTATTESMVATPLDEFSPVAMEFGHRLKTAANGQNFGNAAGMVGLDGFDVVGVDQIDWSGMDWTMASGSTENFFGMAD